MINNKKILAVITARAGSKGIIGKNYKKLLDKPLFIWSVLAALKSKYIDRIAISSNCTNVKKHYLDFAYKNGKNILEKLYWVERPDKYATDTSKNEEALIHSYKIIKEYLKFDADIIINLQPTSPCRLNNLIDKCIKKYNEGRHDSLLTTNKDTPFLWKYKNGKWVYNEGDCCNRKMRQEFNEDEFVYHDNGNIYITDKDILLNTECRIGNNPCAFETKEINSLQIDTEFDFELIEKIIQIKKIKSLI